MALLFTPHGFSESVEDSELLGMTLEQLMSVKVITSTQREQSVHKAPSVVTVFTRRQIEDIGASHLIDILRFAPGVETSLAPDGFYRLAIRGERKEGNILFLLDGSKLNDPYDEQAFFDFPAYLIKQVEIIRGPGSAIYGSSAVSGVINIISRKDGPSIKLAAGNDNKGGVQAQFKQTTSDTEFSATLGIKTSDGDEQRVGARGSIAPVGLFGTTNRFHNELYVNSKLTIADWESGLYVHHRENGDWGGHAFQLGTNSDFKKKSVTTN